MIQSPALKKCLLLFSILFAMQSYSQSVAGYWYGNANVKSTGSANNYLVELIVKENNGHVQGVMNYYFKNIFRSLAVQGNYNSKTRQFILYNIPLTYHGSPLNADVDCIMDFYASLRVSKVSSNLVGAFTSKPAYKYTCVDVNFNLQMNPDAGNMDSVLQAIRLYKEAYQVWKPTAADTLAAVNVVQRKVVNYVVDSEFKKREKVFADEVIVESDSLKVDFYDNGEVDGDSISIFFNDALLSFNRRLSTRSIHFDLVLDASRELNELSMFADNLGSIPPNTALMILYDGKKRYDIRMTSNLEKSATLKIRRKKTN